MRDRHKIYLTLSLLIGLVMLPSVATVSSVLAMFESIQMEDGL